MNDNRLQLLAAAVLAAGAAWCARIDHDRAQLAVSNWIRQNGIARSLFPRTSVEDVVAYDGDANLWIASLSPSGYVVLAGSDLRKPVVAFSRNDFEWPDEESPFFAQLEESAESTADYEDVGGERNEEWNALLARMTLRAAVSESQVSSKILVEPFMTGTRWSQWQPYNDFSPVCDLSGTGAYRGRAPCGCVATALAQVFAYWKWPYRMEGSRTHVHEFWPSGLNKGQVYGFPVRFDGNAPFDWSALAEKYDYYRNGYDLRGKVAESVRFPVARLLLFADSLSQMAFGLNGSGADIDVVCTSASEWYAETEYNWARYTDYSLIAARMKADLAAHRPVLVGIEGHAIVAHGWAEDGDAHYACYNYGWGGQSDGWYLTSGGEAGENLQVCNTGFYPKKMVQVEPLPAVVENSATLNWHLPPCYDGEVTGFEVSKAEILDAVTDFTDDFSAVNGEFLDSVNGGIATVNRIGNLTPILRFDPLYENAYTYPNIFHLTSRSVLSFRLRSAYALHSCLGVQARLSGGEWATIAVPPLAHDTSVSWTTMRLYLGGNGGDDVQVRFVLVRTGDYYYPDAPRMVGIDDVRVSEVRGETKTVQTVSAPTRSLVVQNLESGKDYSFAVKPLFANGGGVASQPLRTLAAGVARIALPGELAGNSLPAEVAWETRTVARAAEPEILSVTGSEGHPQVAEGFYRENELWSNVIRVTCSSSVTELRARPSHLALVCDDDVDVHGLGGGEFAVVIRAYPAKVRARSRMILTLEARNANGTAAYKDLSLRFDPVTVDVETAIFGGEGATVSVPIAWFEAAGLAREGAEYAQLALEDSDGDGFSNLAEYACGTDPLDVGDRLVCFIRIVDGSPVVTHSATNMTPGFRAVVKGAESLSRPDWRPMNGAHRFFKVVVERVGD